MTSRKKTFPCGHRGKGAFCHRCKQEEEIHQKKLKRKSAWNEKIKSSPIDLSHLPKKVAEKTLSIIEMISTGVNYHSLKGKRLVSMRQREVISIPVGWSYRLICFEKDGALNVVEVLSHEDYNNKLSSGGWK